ncbi:hypothetical protein NDU88_005259 [Pleurodeles waltl]|uniref:Uncharacterized protein n=1 Tax=Pleurodeles waltl TaxID=8319 RepID=A0AAV7LP21_PLEWA|nr:hypothetical protein NDU88_005259 [Pleurodeles waltl]
MEVNASVRTRGHQLRSLLLAPRSAMWSGVAPKRCYDPLIHNRMARRGLAFAPNGESPAKRRKQGNNLVTPDPKEGGIRSIPIETHSP